MVKNSIYKLLILIIFINLFSSSFQNNICNSNDNTICESCDSEENKYSSCKYENLYCALTKEKNIYSQCKKMYNKYLRNNDDICGKKDIFWKYSKVIDFLFDINFSFVTKLSELNILFLSKKKKKLKLSFLYPFSNVNVTFNLFVELSLRLFIFKS